MNPRTPQFPWTILRASPKLFLSTLYCLQRPSSIFLTVFLHHSTPTPFLHSLKAPLTKDCECNYMDSFVRMKGVTTQNSRHRLKLEHQTSPSSNPAAMENSSYVELLFTFWATSIHSRDFSILLCHCYTLLPQIPDNLLHAGKFSLQHPRLN